MLHLPNFAASFAITTNASKFASGAILLQTDTNGEWHPCSYLSQFFSPAKWNYDIYDWELLAVIWALKTWCHCLHGSPFPVQVFMDHKNLTYFWQPQALNRCQAYWLLDLSDFDLKIVHIPRKLLTGPDDFFCHPDLLPLSSIDNDDVILLPPSLFINLIDTALSHHIGSASKSDLLVLNVLQSIDESTPITLCSHMSDW